MTKIFWGGSRKLGKLNKILKNRIDNIISSGYQVLLGDASGADLAMQKYLAEKSYPNVKVFCAGDSCRNNVGGWETEFVQINREQKDFLYYAARDERMSNEADYGFMMWDGESKGTLNNIINLIERKRPVEVYFSPKREFFTIRFNRDIERLLSFCSQQDVKRLEKILRINQRIHLEQPQLVFA